MDITVLGSADVTSAKFSPSYLIDGAILFDVAPGIVKRLLALRVNVAAIDDIVISHFHADHYFDIVFLLLERTKSERKTLPLRIFGPRGGIEKIKALFALAYPGLMAHFESLNIVYSDTDVFDVGAYRVTRFKAVHDALIGCHSYVFSEGEKKIAFSGDTSLTDTVHEIASNCRHFICECSVLKGRANHVGVDDMTELLTSYPRCHFLTTHMSDAVRDALSAETWENLTVLDDGMTLTL